MEDIKEELKLFLDAHPDVDFSPAKLKYFRMINKNLSRIIEKAVDEEFPEHNDKEIEKLIETADSGEAFVKLMRKRMYGINRNMLLTRLLENEEMVLPFIMERALTNRQDVYIENATEFFLRCEADISGWILENYDTFKSEYMKQFLCLVLGFKGDTEVIPFLMNEVIRFEKYYPDKDYNQGPILGLQEIGYRFFDEKK